MKICDWCKEKQKAEKKAMELLPEMKYDCLSGSVEHIACGAFNKAIYFSRNVVADLLMSEAELEWYKIWFEKLCGTATTARVREIWTDLEQQLSASQKREAELEIDLEKQDKAYDRVCDELSASQKRVEQLEEDLSCYAGTIDYYEDKMDKLRKRVE